MKKIVDFEKLKEICDKIIMAGIIYDNDKRAALNYVNDWLEAQPDAEEKHGKWVRKDYTISTYAKCTNCNNGFVCEGEWSFEIWSEYMHYCPNCGARMDLGEEA